jgi:5'(3')-deoxyribonucleotidase
MNYGQEGEELYDMIKDPHQYTNVANTPAYAAMLKEARAKFKVRMAAAR